jgi:hypothetical protein
MPVRDYANPRSARAAGVWAVNCDLTALRFKLAGWKFRRALILEARFNPNHDELGRFTFADGAASGGAGSDALAGEPSSDSLSSGSGDYSRNKPGWHEYVTPKNKVCDNAMRCSRQEMADQLARFAVPGQDPSRPVEDREINPVYDPVEGTLVGSVRTTISLDGLTITNTTLPGHIFHDGQIVRSAQQAGDGSWSVSTHGTGNNQTPGMNYINEWFGPDIFNGIDQYLQQNIERHHGAAKQMVWNTGDRYLFADAIRSVCFFSNEA